MTETWLDDSINDEAIFLENYNVFCHNRNRHGGGVALYCHNTLAVRLSTNYIINSLEILCLSIKLNNKNILIACIYRPPGASKKESDLFIEDFYLI